MTDAFADIQDRHEASAVALSENVVADFVEYFRGSVVGHEEEGLLMYLGVLTGWAYDKDCHVNTMGMGPPGSGKSLTKNTVVNLFDDRDVYTKTDASSNAILDSRDWDLSLAAPLDEYDKVDKAIVEVLKSSNKTDDGYAKDRNVENADARGGYEPVEVSADPNPWVLLYAPSSKKGGINDELRDRALTLYFSNDKTTRRGIGRKEFGHEAIATGGTDNEYIYDVQGMGAALRQHIRELPIQQHEETIDTEDGEQDILASRTGGTLVYMPKWVWYACEPIFNIDEDYTNRVYGLVDNLIRGSAILNHTNRGKTQKDIYLDDDTTETETHEAVVVAPQDVANVLSCMPALLSTTHQLTPLKRHILDAVDGTEPTTDADGTTVSRVQEWLDDNDIPHPTRQTLKSRMDELAEEYYLKRWKSAAGPKGQADAYERHEEGALQPPKVTHLQQEADRDGVDLTAETCVDIDPEQPFIGTTDPFRDQPFTETVSDFRVQFSGETVTDESNILAEAMGPSGEDSGYDYGDDNTLSDNGEDEGGQSSLTDVTTDHDDSSESSISQSTLQTDEGVESPSAPQSEQSVALDSDGVPDDPTQQWLLQRLSEVADGESFGSKHKIVHYIGACGLDSTPMAEDMGGTIMDPDHELWANRPDLKDDRVISESDALRELNESYKQLRQKGLVCEDEESGPPAMYQLIVADPKEL